MRFMRVVQIPHDRFARVIKKHLTRCAYQVFFDGLGALFIGRGGFFFFFDMSATSLSYNGVVRVGAWQLRFSCLHSRVDVVYNHVWAFFSECQRSIRGVEELRCVLRSMYMEAIISRKR